MLRQRVITAIVLLALLLPALFASNPWPFALLTLLLIAAAGWEWGRLNAAAGAVAVSLALLVVAAGATFLKTDPSAARRALLWQIGSALWLVGGIAALRAGPGGWAQVPRVLRWVVGVVLLALGWAAIASARVAGLNFVLSVLCIVWAADIAAYFGGRRFGQRKLAPTISPGKTWEGAAAGLLGVGLLAAAWLALESALPVDSASVFRLLLQRGGAAGLLVALVLLTGLSIVGDLFESLVKRAAGAKDSSRLLPGHGGVLDRIDALLPVLPAAMALITF